MTAFVVDDDSDVASFLGLVLTHAGFDVSSFTEPLDALVAASSKPLDLLVSDLKMPHLSGIELGIKVQELWPACRVLLVSGDPDHPDPASLHQAARSSYDFEFLPKPVRTMDLLHKALEMTGHP